MINASTLREHRWEFPGATQRENAHLVVESLWFYPGREFKRDTAQLKIPAWKFPGATQRGNVHFLVEWPWFFPGRAQRNLGKKL